MEQKNNLSRLIESLDKKEKLVVMLAPSFVVDFSYPSIILALKKVGFDKVVEVTFGAKMINREYHKKLKNSKELVIATVCPGIVELVKNKFPEHTKKLIDVDSPMSATAKICKKTYPQHKIVFISPCNFKKIEARKSNKIDFVINYLELKKLLKLKKIKVNKKIKIGFDKFYNDYTKIYPLAGGLSKTAHLKKILPEEQIKITDGVKNVSGFLENPDKQIKFLDATFCKGSCIGGPCVNSKLPLFFRRRRVLKYLKKSKQEDIPDEKKGLIEEAKGINFRTSPI